MLVRARLPIRWKQGAILVLALLFFLYVGAENAFGGWVASYAKSLGNLTPAVALMTPSFFYAALMLGRWAAPLLLRITEEVRLVQAGLLIACAGMAGLVLSNGLAGVITSASVAGLGLACVYPITISLLSREFGPASSRVGSLMFTMSNIGGAVMPWAVGISSNHFGTLKAGLAVPLVGCAAMYGLYLRDSESDAAATPAATYLTRLASYVANATSLQHITVRDNCIRSEPLHANSS